MSSMRPQPRIVHRTDTLLVVEKPAGLALSGGAPGEDDLATWIRQNADFDHALPVYRLEKGASGLVLFAASSVVRRQLMRQFVDNRAARTYIAIASGYLLEETCVADTPLVYNKRAGRMEESVHRGKPAHTTVRVLERISGNTVIQCDPHPGRVHQVRVHLSGLGYPLTVDPVYGGGLRVMLSDYKPGYRPSKRHEERPLIDRLTLHLGSLRFTSPEDAPEAFEMALPKDMRATVNQLGRLARS